MKKVVLIFPGQGSQYVGMGKSLEGHPSFNLLDEANKGLGYNLSQIMLEGPESDLTLTQNTQPAILTYSIGLFQKAKEILDEAGIEIDAVLGHSVGEYPALVAAGALTFEDALKSVHNRGKYMQAAVPAGMGKMYAILRIPADIVEQACKESSTQDCEVMPANFNEPGQIVISGSNAGVDIACEKLTKAGARRALKLNVGGAFHSPLMEPAKLELEEAIHATTVSKPICPIYQNVTGQVVSNPDIIKSNLIAQLTAPVKWTQTVNQMLRDGATSFTEVGPGRVLCGLIKKVNRQVETSSEG